MTPIESFDDSHAITLIGTGPGLSSRMLKLGEVIGGSYRLKSLLGKGGMGYVFCAEHTMIHHDYALKMLAPEHLNEDSRLRLEIEGRAIANLDHPNIVKVYNMGLDSGDCPFYVMDLLDGIALSDCISARQDIALEECLDIFSQIASGLAYAHIKGIVHRDVKPSNVILLQDKKGGRHVKIVDFGIAKLLPSATLQSQSLTATGEVFGSPSYMSPEQCRGVPVDHRSDIYSLGCTLFETLCGRPPFSGQSVIATLMMHQQEPVPSILEARPEKSWPQSIDILLTKMMAKRADDRYQSMEQVIHDLERIRQGKAIGTAIGKASGSSPGVDAKAYAGRSGRFADGDGRDEKQEVAEGLALSAIDGGRLATIIIASLLVLAASLAGGWLCFRGANQSGANRPIRPAAVVPEMALDPDLEKSRKAFKDCQQIKSVIVIKDGIRRRKFVFPEWIIGTVFAPGGERIEAKGVQYFPAEGPLTLQIGKGASLQLLYNPEVIDKIDCGEFNNLMIEFDQMGGSDQGAYLQTDAIVHILKAASKWSKLELVSLSQCLLSKEVLDIMNDFPKLRYFTIEHSTIDAGDLAGQQFLRRLLFLKLSTVKNIGPVCHSLGSSATIYSVYFEDCNTLPQDLLELRNCPQLVALELEEKKFAPLVLVVPKLPGLQQVHFIRTHLSPAQIKIITACPHLRRLWLWQGKYTAQERELYQRKDRKISFEGY